VEKDKALSRTGILLPQCIPTEKGKLDRTIPSLIKDENFSYGREGFLMG
jgi:hypothetical protein